MARILLNLVDQEVLEVATKALSETKHSVSCLGGLTLEAGLEKAGELISAEKADLVIMDYWNEDLAGIKLMQAMVNISGPPVFIFIESDYEAGREEIMLALNEGAKAFLPHNFSKASLLNHVKKALAGNWRFQQQTKELASATLGKEIANLEEQLISTRTSAKSFQKLVSHLLANPKSSQDHTVLVVSDSPYQLEVLKNILEDHHFKVLTASTATEGLEIATQQKPRFIVSDLELEDMSGLDFCKEVKMVKKIIPCYFVICTANQDKVDTIMAPGNGLDDCLPKPSGQHDNEDFISKVALGLLL